MHKKIRTLHDVRFNGQGKQQINEWKKSAIHEKTIQNAKKRTGASELSGKPLELNGQTSRRK